MVEMPEHYPWSSVHANLALRSDSVVTPHETFLSIAPDRMQRAEAYRVWLRAGVNDDELTDIRQHIKQERALGSPRFQAMAEKTLDDRSSCGSKGDRDVSKWTKAKPRARLNYPRPLIALSPYRLLIALSPIWERIQLTAIMEFESAPGKELATRCDRSAGWFAVALPRAVPIFG
jgi:hypothetical protein